MSFFDGAKKDWVIFFIAGIVVLGGRLAALVARLVIPIGGVVILTGGLAVLAGGLVAIDLT